MKKFGKPFGGQESAAEETMESKIPMESKLPTGRKPSFGRKKGRGKKRAAPPRDFGRF